MVDHWYPDGNGGFTPVPPPTQIPGCLAVVIVILVVGSFVASMVQSEYGSPEDNSSSNVDSAVSTEAPPENEVSSTPDTIVESLQEEDIPSTSERAIEVSQQEFSPKIVKLSELTYDSGFSDDGFVNVMEITSSNGTKYNNVLTFSTTDGFVKYNLDGEYTELLGVVFLTEGWDDVGEEFYIDFLGDNKVLKSITITGGFLPEIISLDITGVREFEVHYSEKTKLGHCKRPIGIDAFLKNFSTPNEEAPPQENEENPENAEGEESPEQAE